MPRTCNHCGKPITFSCMTTDDGTLYVHEECFEDYMDKEYGKGKWMGLGNGEEHGCGGFYIHTADVIGGFEGTGIYYTEYEEENACSICKERFMCDQLIYDCPRETPPQGPDDELTEEQIKEWEALIEKERNK